MIESKARVLMIHTLGNSHYYCNFMWESIKLEHPSTFETLALHLELKNMIVEDLNRFLRRKEFYKKVGQSWKRGYLLYGPPGTGKSTLVAAMANYLQFDIYDLQLENIKTDSDLRKLLLDIANKSILVIEDIDCTVNLPDHPRVSGNKRSGQDKQAFSVLASNYLGVEGDHRLFKDIKELLEATEVTPAQVAEELTKNEVTDVALEGFLSFLKRKKAEVEAKAEASKKPEIKGSREPKMKHK
ncbi:putative Cytochrome BC1 synthesis [Hibiscus syriacus]|uniref:Cytochrome BC1 synthesis n=1 Tax=Hibiscus syriacus TaxID=106335 RepID=A0A6A2XQ36_HIBSY|nr:putative Cytochrome BC1 synthesis [Hibiscus syriacus]